MNIAFVSLYVGYGTNCGGSGKLSSATKEQVGAITV